MHFPLDYHSESQCATSRRNRCKTVRPMHICKRKIQSSLVQLKATLWLISPAPIRKFPMNYTDEAGNGTTTDLPQNHIGLTGDRARRTTTRMDANCFNLLFRENLFGRESTNAKPCTRDTITQVFVLVIKTVATSCARLHRTRLFRQKCLPHTRIETHERNRRTVLELKHIWGYIFH